MNRRLGLRREALTQLTKDELETLAAGESGITRFCATQYNCPSLDYCPTLPIRDCPLS